MPKIHENLKNNLFQKAKGIFSSFKEVWNADQNRLTTQHYLKIPAKIDIQVFIGFR